MLTSLRSTVLVTTFVALMICSNADARFDLDTEYSPVLESPAAKLLVGHWSGTMANGEERTVVHIRLRKDAQFAIQFQSVNAEGHVLDQGLLEGEWTVANRSLQLFTFDGNNQDLPFLLKGDSLKLSFAGEGGSVKLHRHNGSVVEVAPDPNGLVAPLPYTR